MVLGARPIGTRSLGDSTGDVGLPAITGDVQYGSVALAAEFAASFGGRLAAEGAVAFLAEADVAWTPTQAVTAVLRLGGRARALFRAPAVETYDPAKGREQYRLVVSDLEGDTYGDLDNARIENTSWVLNGIGELSASVPVQDTKALLPEVPTREVQLWRGKRMLWVGPVVRKHMDGSHLRLDAKDLNWYFTRRHIGKANRTNYVNNPSFEEGIKHWTIVSGEPTLPVEQLFPRTVTIEKSPVFDGRRSLRFTMSQEDPSVGAAQLLVWSVPSNLVEGETWTASAWFYIDSWSGPGYRYRGLQIMRASTTESVPIYTPAAGKVINYPKVQSVSTHTIDKDTPRKKWIRAEVPLVQPPKAGVPEFIDISVSGIRGTIYWDLVSLTRNEGLHFNNVDESLIVRDLVRHAQDPAYGKSDLNIGTSTPLSGVKRSRSYYFHDHEQVWDALSEWPAADQGVDISIEAGPTKRTFTTHFPYKGYKRHDVVLEYKRNIDSFTVTEDGEQTSNSVVVLGEGSGSDREEGGHIDASTLDGLILEKVYNGVPGAPIQTLNAQAIRGVERFKHTVTIPEVTTYEGTDLIGVLRTGDIVRVKIDYGALQVNDWYRVIEIKLDPNLDQLTLSINPLTEEQIEL